MNLVYQYKTKDRRCYSCPTETWGSFTPYSRNKHLHLVPRL